MLMTGRYCGLDKEKDLTKHVCQPGKLSLQTGILPGLWLLTTPLQMLYYSCTSSVPSWLDCSLTLV